MASVNKGRGKGFGDERYRAIIAALVDARTRQGLTQQSVADRLGRHQQFVSRYEHGERRLDIVEFLDVALALGVDPSDLIRPQPMPDAPLAE